MGRGWFQILAAMFALGGATVATAQVPDSLLTAIHSLQQDDTRLQSLGWKLGRANVAFCPTTQSAIGLLLFDVRNFNQPDPLRIAIGLSGDIGVEAVAQGSPAQAAGLSPGDEITAIAGRAMAALPPVKTGDFTRLGGLHDAIDAALAGQGAVTLGVKSGGVVRRVTVVGEPICASRFELLTSGNHAGADGQTVRLGRNILAESPQDAEAATLVAHEFAHDILGHPARLGAHGRAARKVRETEREADRLAVWLIANAGYDPAAAARFMLAWGARHDPIWTRAPSHDGFRTRAALMEAERAKVAARLGSGAKLPLDWRAEFGVR